MYGKFHYRTGHVEPNVELRYSFNISLTSALDRGGCSPPRLSRFNHGNDPVPIVRGLGELQGRSERVRKISTPPGFDPRTVHHVAICVPTTILYSYPNLVLQLTFFMKETAVQVLPRPCFCVGIICGHSARTLQRSVPQPLPTTSSSTSAAHHVQ